MKTDTLTQPKKNIVGSIESCHLPDLHIFDLHTRIDTGAATSSLHVDNIEKFKKEGKPWLRFDIHPDAYHVNEVQTCEAILYDLRSIKSSNGTAQLRYVIKTTLQLGEQQWSILVTLTNRADMKFLMLLGREAMGDRLLVDPSQTFLLGTPD